MQTGIKSISLDDSSGTLAGFEAVLVPRAVGLGRLMLDSGGVSRSSPICTRPVPLVGACVSSGPNCVLSPSDGLSKRGSGTAGCRGKAGLTLITAQDPGSILGPQGSEPSCFCGRRSISLQQDAQSSSQKEKPRNIQNALKSMLVFKSLLLVSWKIVISGSIFKLSCQTQGPGAKSGPSSLFM